MKRIRSSDCPPSVPFERRLPLLEFSDSRPINRTELTADVYKELQRIATRILKRESAGHILEPSALVNEAIMRMLRKPLIPLKGRSHLVGVSVHMMRQVLIDYARWRNAAKRSGRYPHVELTRELADRSLSIVDRLDTVLAVHAALARLAEFAPRLAQIALLRFFWGFSIREVAKALDVGRSTINEDWKLARTWLRRELQ